MNVIAITGRLTADPTQRTTKNGNSTSTFTVAVSRPNAKEVTDFITVRAYGQQAEFVEKYFQKGKPIEVYGVLTINNYEKDGQKKQYVEVIANTISFAMTERK